MALRTKSAELRYFTNVPSAIFAIHAMPQAFSVRSPSAEAWVQCQASPYRAFDWHSVKGTGFSPEYLLSPVSIAPPILHIRILFKYHWRFAYGSSVEQNTLPPHSIIFKLRVTQWLCETLGLCPTDLTWIAYTLLKEMKNTNGIGVKLGLSHWGRSID